MKRVCWKCPLCYRFLFNKQSAAYQQYRQIVEQCRSELGAVNQDEYKPEDIYEPENTTDDENDHSKHVSNILNPIITVGV